MKRRTFTSDDYDRGCFDDGVATGKSLYTKYEFDPVLTPADVSAIIEFAELTKGESILDFGCAKGFHVLEFRIRGFDCWGCDISEYAIQSAHPSIRPYLRLNRGVELPFDRGFDCVVFKDVLEHLTEAQVSTQLRSAPARCQ